MLTQLPIPTAGRTLCNPVAGGRTVFVGVLGAGAFGAEDPLTSLSIRRCVDREAVDVLCFALSVESCRSVRCYWCGVYACR